VKFGDLFAVVRVLQMNGQRTGDALDRSFRSVHMDTLSAEKRTVDPPDALYEKESVFVNMRNHETEFVDMAGKNDVRFFVRIAQTREGVAVGVSSEFVAVGFDVIRPDALAAGLESGRRWCCDEILEKFERGFVHVRTMQTADRGGKTSTAENPWGTMPVPR